MTTAMGRAALGAVVAVVVGGCSGEGRSGGPVIEARSCRIRLAGPLSGEFRCEGSAFRQEDGWFVSAMLAPGSRVAGSLLVPGAGPTDSLPGARALLRGPGRAGVGVIWGGKPRGRADIIMGIDGNPVSAQVTAVVLPLRANPVREPIEVVVELDLGGAGYVAQLPGDVRHP